MNNSDIKYIKMWDICDKYDLEILDYISRDLICFLCEKVIKNAYQNICGCKYCCKCIMKHILFGSLSCPGKSEECQIQSLTKTTIQIDHALNKKISKLLVKCPFDDCYFSSELINIETHIIDHEMDSIDSVDNRKDLSLIESFRIVENKVLDLKKNSNQFESLLTEMAYRLEHLFSSESNYNDYNNHLMSTNVISQNSMSFENPRNNDEKCLKILLQTMTDMKQNITSKSKEIIDKTNQATSNTINNEIENNKLERNIDIIYQNEQSIEKSNIANSEYDNNIDEDLNNAEFSRKLYDDVVVVTRINKERTPTRESPEEDNIECGVITKNDKDLSIKCNAKKRKVKLKKSNNLISSFSVQEQLEKKNNICRFDINIKNMSPFLWKIKNFYKQFNNARLNKITNFDSDKFYSHFCGYRLALKIYPNGYKTAQGTHLSVFFYLLKGENDEFLEWPMKRCVNISLLNQATNEIYLEKKFDFETCCTLDVVAFSKPITISNKMVGETHFISLKTLLYDNRILKNDSVAFLCTVKD